MAANEENQLRPICAPPRRRSRMAKAERERGLVRAPISGVVSDVPVTTGQALQANARWSPRSIALDPMLAVVEVAERQLGEHQASAIRPSVRLVTGQTAKGTVRFVSPTASSRRAPTGSRSRSTTPTARSPTA